MNLRTARRLLPPAAWFTLGAGLAAGAFFLAARQAPPALPGAATVHDAAAFQDLARHWAASDIPWIRSTLRQPREDLDRLLLDLTLPLLAAAALPTPFPDRTGPGAEPAYAFIDFSCPACQADHHQLAAAAEPHAFRVLPILLPDPGNETALQAARAAHWVAHRLPHRYAPLHHRLMTDGPGKLPAILAELGIPAEWIDDADPEPFQRHIAHTRLVADALIVHGTPATVTRETLHRGALVLRPGLLTPARPDPAAP